ncbi:hypothetical protein BOX15_Mlig020831g1 [Macrostomum lignano]|uniref:Poly [ADP-ribose] polymerase n=2 Tax=Macrostomum lignano TaxID=282301 RepID=A0A267FUI1_9PLAT|nr:hypothetical protein BOX15_Mlig020831g1 [Macrostomum lignano]
MGNSKSKSRESGAAARDRPTTATIRFLISRSSTALSHEPESAAIDNIKRTVLKEDDEDTAQEYFKVLDRVKRYTKEHYYPIINSIESIEKIENPFLDRRLVEISKKLHAVRSRPELLIHGTRSRFVEQMIRDGFSYQRKGLFGQGFYFYTDSSKAARGCGRDTIKCLLLCDVLLGETMAMKSADRSLNLSRIESAGFDSVYGVRGTKESGGVFNDEYVVFRTEQIAPRYLVRFRENAFEDSENLGSK